jgi:hypothetical protein
MAVTVNDRTKLNGWDFLNMKAGASRSGKPFCEMKQAGSLIELR